jgi:hypothetical protein
MQDYSVLWKQPVYTIYGNVQQGMSVGWENYSGKTIGSDFYELTILGGLDRELHHGASSAGCLAQ